MPKLPTPEDYAGGPLLIGDEVSVVQPLPHGRRRSVTVAVVILVLLALWSCVAMLVAGA